MSLPTESFKELKVDKNTFERFMSYVHSGDYILQYHSTVQDSFINKIMNHTRLYVFAVKYEVEDLQLFVSKKVLNLFLERDQAGGRDEEIDLVYTLEYVYGKTNKSSEGKPSSLRRAMMQGLKLELKHAFASQRSARLAKAFDYMLTRNEEIAADYVHLDFEPPLLMGP